MKGRSWAGTRLHFIGIGGAGMSALAAACLKLGALVSGSDRADSSYSDRIRELGAKVALGHDEANLPADALVIVSTAIGPDNPELKLARERGQEVIHRGHLLAELCAQKRLIAVAGTHGKTSTTAMIAWALRALGAEPSFFIGGEMPSAAGAAEAVNSAWTEGTWVVAEADESDGSFLELKPEIAVITNIELDHHSRWSGTAELKAAFAEFVAGAETVISGPEVDLDHSDQRRFDSDHPGPPLTLAVPGTHNLLNARGSIAALAAAGFSPDEVAGALTDFPGVRRRLEFKGLRDGARIYDDYAHHPTEVRAALSALRELQPRRLIALFQPHLYSRTRAFAAEFGAALTVADVIGVLDVYPAREEPVGKLAGVSGLSVAEAAADRAQGAPVWWLATADNAYSAFADEIGEGDILVTLGAGDITSLSDRLVES